MKYKVTAQRHTTQPGIPSRRGTGSTAGATGGLPTTTPGIPAGASGAACGRSPWWWWGGQQPPEVVAEQTVEIGPDGTVEVEIDTAIAKEMHGDHDHKYTITAEVVDESRRTIVGTGEVLVARKPFKVFAWVDRGYYRVGRHGRGAVSTRRRSTSKPVKGTGKVELLQDQLPRTASRSKRRCGSGTWTPTTRARPGSRSAPAKPGSIACRTS